jgi:flagellar biosynthesis component FlhA
MERICYIYGLYSTRFIKQKGFKQIKYIGKSFNPESRLRQHLNKCYKSESILYRWMLDELNRGAEIKLTILDSCLELDSVLKEKEWIKKLSQERTILNSISNKQKTANSLDIQLQKVRKELAESKIIIKNFKNNRDGIIISSHQNIENKSHIIIDNQNKQIDNLKFQIEQLEKFITTNLNSPLPNIRKKRKKL